MARGGQSLHKAAADETGSAAFDKSRLPDQETYPLENAFGSQGADFVRSISRNNKIVFHLVGDSGATQEGKKYKDELGVSDVLSSESRSASPADCPAFLYHLGGG